MPFSPCINKFMRAVRGGVATQKEVRLLGSSLPQTKRRSRDASGRFPATHSPVHCHVFGHRLPHDDSVRGSGSCSGWKPQSPSSLPQPTPPQPTLSQPTPPPPAAALTALAAAGVAFTAPECQPPFCLCRRHRRLLVTLLRPDDRVHEPGLLRHQRSRLLPLAEAVPQPRPDGLGRALRRVRLHGQHNARAPGH